MKYYRLYAKWQNQKTFKALDLSTGKQVNNLIRATLLTGNECSKIMNEVYLNNSNPDREYTLKFVKVSN